MCVLWSYKVRSKAAYVVVCSKNVVFGLVDVVGQPKEERVRGIVRQRIRPHGYTCRCGARLGKFQRCEVSLIR